jgi:integrase
LAASTSLSTSVKTAFKRAVKLAELPGKVSPHTLRHTAATWLMQAGADRWQAAGYLGMSVEMLDRVYGHHHPDHLQDAVRAIGKRGAREQKRDVSGAVYGAVTKMKRPKPS